MIQVQFLCLCDCMQYTLISVGVTPRAFANRICCVAVNSGYLEGHWVCRFKVNYIWQHCDLISFLHLTQNQHSALLRTF